MSSINQVKYWDDNERFSQISPEVVEFIKTIDFTSINEVDYHPNKAISIIKNIEQEVDYILNTSNKIDLKVLIEEFKEFVWGFFSQIYLKTNSFVSVCNGHSRIISNVSFKEFTWRENNPISNIYNTEQKQIIEKKVEKLLSWSIAGYHEIFHLHGEDVAWTTVRLPFSQINIRFWFITWEKKDYGKFYQTWDIEHIDFHENDFYFMKKVLSIYKQKYEKLVNLFRDEKRKDFQKLFNQIKIKALILDYMLKFNPNPIVFYDGKTPIALSESYLKITSYSYEEIMYYFQKYWEITTLFYKWEDLEEVRDILENLKTKTILWAWYDGLEFTLTRKDKKRVRIPWSNHIYLHKNVNGTTWNLLSFRIGDIWNLEII